MDIREKLVELLKTNACPSPFMCDPTCRYYGFGDCFPDRFADYLIAHGVTMQKHGYLETVVEVKGNTVCGNGAKIEYKRCSCCKNPVKFFEDDFCGSCGAKLDLSQPAEED